MKDRYGTAHSQSGKIQNIRKYRQIWQKVRKFFNLVCIHIQDIHLCMIYIFDKHGFFKILWLSLILRENKHLLSMG